MVDDEASNGLPYGLSDLPAGPLGDRAQAYSPFELAAMRTRRSVLRNREVGRFDTDPATIASLGASALPASGSVEIAGYMPDFRGGYEPSLLKTWQDGNYLDAGLLVLGAVGGPPGVIGKAIRRSRGALRLAAHAPIFDRSLRRTEGVPQIELPRKGAGQISRELSGLFSAPGLEDAMLKVIEKGKGMGGLDWYNTEPLRQMFIKHLGPDGDERFREYMRYVAATSAQSDVGVNVRNASFYFGKARRGETLPDVGSKNESPYGHRSARNHQIFARKVFDDELDPVRYQKLNSFYQNLIGNYAPVTVDTHALRLPAILARDKNFLEPHFRKLLDAGKISMDQLVQKPVAWRAPTAAEYAAIEQFYKNIAKKAGLSPAQAQSAAWVGGETITGVRSNGLRSILEHFEDRAHLAGAKNNIPGLEALTRFIKGEINLSALYRAQSSVA